jgi:Protein of unknown function (DUF1573)
MLKINYQKCSLKSTKICAKITAYILFILVLGLTQTLKAQTEIPEDTITQTEIPEDTTIRYYDKVYDETYAVDTIEYRDTITISLNDSLEIDSFELGSVHEYTFNVDDRRSVSSDGNGTGTGGSGTSGTTQHHNNNSGQGQTRNTEQISTAEPDCTCTNPTWYTQPIPPGETGWLKIRYNATIPDKKTSIINVIIKNPIKIIAVIPVQIIAIVKNPPLSGN